MMHTHRIWTIKPLTWYTGGPVPMRRTSEEWARGPKRDPSGKPSLDRHRSYQLGSRYRAYGAYGCINDPWHQHAHPDAERFGHYHHGKHQPSACVRCLQAEYWTYRYGTL